MAFQVVSLLTALLVTSVRGQGYPMIGGFAGGNPFMPGGYHNRNQHQQGNTFMLTCINADTQDHRSQIRLTLRPLNAQAGGHLPAMGLGFGPLSNMMDPNREQDWAIDGIMLPSQLVQKAGTYRVAVFENGRTFGKCKRSALGQVLDTTSAVPTLAALRMGPFSSFGMSLHPMASIMAGMYGQTQPNGVASNNALVSTGTTMYSGRIHKVSYNNLAGRSIGVCGAIKDRQCYGLIPHCCSITKDPLPASEDYVDSVAGFQQGNLAFNQGSFAFNQGNLVNDAQAGAALPLSGGRVTNVAVDKGGLF